MRKIIAKIKARRAQKREFAEAMAITLWEYTQKQLAIRENLKRIDVEEQEAIRVIEEDLAWKLHALSR